MTKDLMEIYREWRKVNAELEADGNTVSNDCGEQAVREDFSNYAELESVIRFEEMEKLEKEYNK